MPCAIVAICSFYHIFLCFGLMVRTQSRPYGLCHRLYTKAHIKGFGWSYLHVYASLLLCFMLVLASLVLRFAMLFALRGLDLVWLYPTPMRPCLGVTIWEASLDAGLLRTYPSLSTPCDAMLTHVCSCHLLAFHASLHACSHVHAWVLLASVSSMLQHNEVIYIRSKPTFVPYGHHLLFAFLLVCLFLCLLVCLLSCFFACHVYHAYLLYASFICSLHLLLPLLVCWFLIFAFASTYMEWGCVELGQGLPITSKKGKVASMWICAKWLCSVDLGI